jgi:hypothetical protein
MQMLQLIYRIIKKSYNKIKRQHNLKMERGWGCSLQVEHMLNTLCSIPSIKKNGQKIWIDISPKTIYKWPVSPQKKVLSITTFQGAAIKATVRAYNP